jgi:DNA-binding NarL/FixJ family response regulator
MPTILVFEDHGAVRESFRQWLEVRFPWCRVIAARCGEEALALVPVEAPELVLMDIALPGMSGIEATRQIKATPAAAEVVILTIREDNSYRTDAARAGASAFVTKRTMQTELIPTLAELLTE